MSVCSTCSSKSLHQNVTTFLDILHTVSCTRPASLRPIAYPKPTCSLVVCRKVLGTKTQQLTYGVVSEGVVAESLRKFCGNFAEICREYVSLHQERVRKFCGKFAEISRRLRKIFCNDPFPNDPISKLLKNKVFRSVKVRRGRRQGTGQKMS